MQEAAELLRQALLEFRNASARGEEWAVDLSGLLSAEIARLQDRSERGDEEGCGPLTRDGVVDTDPAGAIRRDPDAAVGTGHAATVGPDHPNAVAPGHANAAGPNHPNSFGSDPAGVVSRDPHGAVVTGHATTDHPNAVGSNRANAVAPDLDPLLRLVELGRRLATEGDPDEVLRIVLHEAIGLTGAERGFLVLAKEEDFEFALAENMDRSEVLDPRFEVSRSLIRKVLHDLKPILLALPDEADAPGDVSTGNLGDPARKSLADIGARSVACVPIVHAGAPLGVLYLDGRDPEHTFRGPMERCLDLFASQAAAALENARSHRAKARALEAAEETIRRHRTESARRVRYEGLIGASDAMQEVYRKLDIIAPTEMPVIILGETGTGKELVARLLHACGPRSRKEFVALNCAGMPETLLEAELFGHERGAFTGAERTRPGLFEVAHRGTLFLDEVGDMSPRMQADLLRALQSGEVRRIGGRETILVDVRIIAATHRNLEELVRRGEFRQDLYFRLNVLGLRLPALRERAEDIPLLAAELMTQVPPKERTATTLSERALRRLAAYRWPGNVRELQNVLRRLSVIGVAVIEEEHLPSEVLGGAQRAERPGTLRNAEDDAVRRAFEASGGNKTEAARILGVDRKTLYTKLRRLGLDAQA